MRFILGTTAVLAVLYSGYWVVGQQAVNRGAVAVIDQMRADGTDIAYADLSTVGFPSRFDTTVTDLRLTTPDGALTWSAPFVQVFALSYLPNRWIAVGPPEQVVSVAGSEVRVSSEDLRASISAGVSTDLPLDAVTAEASALRVEGAGFGALSLDRLLVALRDRPGEEIASDYDIYAEATGLALPETWRARLDPEGALPATIEVARINGAMVLADPIDRTGAPVLLRDLTLTEARIAWGDLALTVTGSMRVGADGIPAGTFTIVAAGWQGMVDMAVAAGTLGAGQATMARGGLAALAEGGPDLTLDLVLSEDGTMRLGPLPLGPSPRFGP